jgi:hypothetical protein
MGVFVVDRLHDQLVEQGLFGVNNKKGLLALAQQTFFIIAYFIRCAR